MDLKIEKEELEELIQAYERKNTQTLKVVEAIFTGIINAIGLLKSPNPSNTGGNPFIDNLMKAMNGQILPQEPTSPSGETLSSDVPQEPTVKDSLYL